MTTRAIETIQTRLRDLGFYAGTIDNEEGPVTEAAATDFKEVNGLLARPYLGPITLALLFSSEAKAIEQAPSDVPPWYEQAQKMDGLHEVDDNAALKSFLRADGATLGDPAVLPWCGDFVETCLKLALPSEGYPDNPYLARNWLKFGRSCTPQLGAVLVFWRGSRSGISGHVGFYVGEDASAYHVLGGNQSNAVCVSRLGKDRLLGARWPKGYAMSGETVRLDGTGALSTNEA